MLSSQTSLVMMSPRRCRASCNPRCAETVFATDTRITGANRIIDAEILGSALPSCVDKTFHQILTNAAKSANLSAFEAAVAAGRSSQLIHLFKMKCNECGLA